MADIQKQVEGHIEQIDSQYDGKVADKQAAAVIIDAIKNRDPSRLSNYRGDIFHKNDAKAQKLLALMYQEVERTLGERIRSERAAIIDTSKRDSGKVKSLFETRKKLTDQQVEDRALSGVETANQFKYINTELNKAFIKDLEGHFIEGGILGMLNNPNTALRKAISNIEKKYGSAVAGEVQRALREISGSMETAQVILNQNKSGVRKIGEGLASVVGYRNGSKLEKYWETNPDFRKYMAHNLRKQLIEGGISILIGVGTGTFYGGMMKTPFKIQTVPTPTKDIVAMALYGGDASAHSIMQGSINEIDSYISRGMRNGVRAGGAEQIQRGIAQGIDIDAKRVEHDINQANNSVREFIDKIPLLGRIFDDEHRLKNDMVEYAKIMENTHPSAGERARATVLNARISNKLNAARSRLSKRNGNNPDVALQTISDTIAGTRQVVAVEALREGNKLKAFLNSHRNYADIEGKLPTRDPIVHQAFQAYYTGKSFAGHTGDSLLQHIWEDPSIPGVQRMVQAYTKGDYKERAAYMREYCSTGIEGKTISTVGSKWAGNIEKIIQDPEAVQDYVTSHKNKANGLAIAYGYASKVDQLTNGRLIIDPGDILNAIGNGRYNPNFSGQNTGVSTSALSEKYNYTNKPALECHVPATIDGIHGTLTIGVKPDCANLVIGEFRPEDYNPNNPDANIMLRVPLLYTVKKGAEQVTTKKTKTVKETPKKSVTPTRNAPPQRPPMKPPVKPPVKPAQPQVSSTPGGSTGTVPQEGGYPVNPAGEGGSTGSFIPSVNTPPASPGAVGVGETLPTPANTPFNPFE